MKNPNVWARHPWLPVKRSRDHSHLFGLMVAVTGRTFEVFGLNVYHLPEAGSLGEVLAKAEWVLKYDSHEAIVRDEWKIDD